MPEPHVSGATPCFVLLLSLFPSGSAVTNETRYLSADDPLGQPEVILPRTQDVEYGASSFICTDCLSRMTLPDNAWHGVAANFKLNCSTRLTGHPHTAFFRQSCAGAEFIRAAQMVVA